MVRREPAADPAYDALADADRRAPRATRCSPPTGRRSTSRWPRCSHGRWIGLAESCTGGLLAARLTERPGSSEYVAGGVVSYSNEAKASLLGVDPALIERFGAVSPEVASAMADGALARFAADTAVAITGVAGPGGGTEAKPVGYVCWSVKTSDGRVLARDTRVPGDRAEVRDRSTTVAMHLLQAAAARGARTTPELTRRPRGCSSALDAAGLGARRRSSSGRATQLAGHGSLRIVAPGGAAHDARLPGASAGGRDPGGRGGGARPGSGPCLAASTVVRGRRAGAARQAAAVRARPGSITTAGPRACTTAVSRGARGRRVCTSRSCATFWPHVTVARVASRRPSGSRGGSSRPRSRAVRGRSRGAVALAARAWGSAVRAARGGPPRRMTLG